MPDMFHHNPHNLLIITPPRKTCDRKLTLSASSPLVLFSCLPHPVALFGDEGVCF